MSAYTGGAYLPGSSTATVTSLNDAGNATVGGTLTTTAVVDQGALSETGMINPTGLAGTLNDWAPTGFSGARHVYMTLSSSATLNGIAGGTDGRVITIYADPLNGNSVNINHENAASLAANRVQCVGQTTYPMLASNGVSTITLRYNASVARWQQIAGSGVQDNFVRTVAGPFNWTANTTPSTLAASINDWAPTSGTEYRVTPAGGGSTITGLGTGAGSNGRIVVITNISTGIDPVILKHDDGTLSTAANRFLFPYNQSIVIPPGGSAILRYDGTSSRWRPLDTPPQLNGLISMPMQSGRYYFAPNVATGTSSASMGNNLLRFMAFYVPNMIAVSRLGAEVNVAGDVGSKVRLGIYADDGTGRPGALVVDAGTIAGDSATVQEITLGSPPTLIPGVYWAAQCVQLAPTTVPTLRVHAVGGIVPNIDVGTTTPPSGSSGGAFLQAASCSGALPNPATTVNASGNLPRLFFKVA